MKIEKPILLISSIFISQAAGIIGSVFTTSAIPTWYAGLEKPSFGPPNWLFGPVWITLYTLMGISLYLVWVSGIKNKRVKYAITVFFINLVLNALWSLIFFGMKNPQIAFFEIVILWGFIVYLIRLFSKINLTSAIILIPYLIWVTFASILNFSIWKLN